MSTNFAAWWNVPNGSTIETSVIDDGSDINADAGVVRTDNKQYKYDHDEKNSFSGQNYFPEDISREQLYFPKDIGLADHLDNEESCLVVSKQLKKFLESKITSPIEYLSVTIFNHKNQVASNEYFIVNPLNVVDCINLEESEVEWNSLDSEDIDDLEELVFDEGKIDDNMLIFRAKYLDGCIFVHEDLVKEIKKQGFTGNSFEV